jgi:hypothetical protein
LKRRTVEIISDFYNSHDLNLKEFGSDLGSLNWKDIGLNAYGNSLIVNGAFLQKNPKLSEDFVPGPIRLRTRGKAALPRHSTPGNDELPYSYVDPPCPDMACGRTARHRRSVSVFKPGRRRQAREMAESRSSRGAAAPPWGQQQRLKGP